jgi:predicted TIM-barrel fold metal-dependent hydrolase
MLHESSRVLSLRRAVACASESGEPGSLDWILPRAEFHAYLAALLRAGFGKRIMFGSDHMFWPEAIAIAVDSAAFLNSDERRDIFYTNAVRFFRLGDR